MNITPRKKKLLTFIDSYHLKHGFAPSIPEIAKHFNLAVSTVHQHLEELKDGGYLKKTKNQTRALELFAKNDAGSVLEPAPLIIPEDKKNILKHSKLPLNKILHGDAVEIMQNMPESSIDLTVTSPPYDELRVYNGYNFNFEAIAKSLYRVTKSGGILVWVVGDKIKNGNKSLTSFKQALYFQEVGFNVHDVMIYRKKNTPFMRSNAYTNCYEFMFVFSKDRPRAFNPIKTKTIRQGKEMLPFNKGVDGVNKKVLAELKPEKTMTNIWEYAVGLHGTTSDKIAFKHPAVFPEKLAEDHILSWTNEGDVVFDPMCGSGTTCKMALLTKRSYIGCDISKDYVNLAIERLKLFDKKTIREI